MEKICLAEKQFHVLLNALARHCRFDLDEITVEVYDKYLSSYGYEKVNVALQELLVNRNSRDPFPSAKEIERVMKPQVSHKSVATLIANTIRKYIRLRGRYWKVDQQEIGPLAYKVVMAQGGWSALCERCNDTDPGIFFPQLERSIAAVLEGDYVEEQKHHLEGRTLEHLGVGMKVLE